MIRFYAMTNLVLIVSKCVTYIMIAPMVRTKLDVKRRLRVIPISSDVIRREFMDELWAWLGYLIILRSVLNST